MSQGSYPPPPQFAPKKGLSGTALTGFILSLVICIPLLTSLTAIFLSIVGLRRTRAGMARGRGLALAGLIIGTAGVVGWLAIAGFSWSIISASAAPRATLHEFAAKLTAGDMPGATALCDPSLITPEDLDRLHTELAKLGTYSDLTCYSINLSSGTAGTQCVLAGVIKFSSGPHGFNAILRKDATGTWKVYGFHVDASP